MGNKNPKKKYNIGVNHILSRQIQETLTKERKKVDIDSFKQGMQKLIINMKLPTHRLSNQLVENDKNKLIKITQAIITQAYDSNSNHNNYNNLLNCSLQGSLFLYNLFEDNVSNKREDRKFL